MPTLPTLLIEASSICLKVVVLQRVGLGVVVVLGPFLDKITDSKFHFNEVCGLAMDTKKATHTKIKLRKFMIFMVFFFLFVKISHDKI